MFTKNENPKMKNLFFSKMKIIIVQLIKLNFIVFKSITNSFNFLQLIKALPSIVFIKFDLTYYNIKYYRANKNYICHL